MLEESWRKCSICLDNVDMVVGLQQALKGQLEPNVICWGVLCLVHPSVTYFL